MMRELFFDESLDLIRAAVLEEGLLCEIHTEKAGKEDPTETLYLGRVQAVRQSINAAFIDIGMDIHAFLPLDGTSDLRSGDWIIVQGAAKQTTDTKGLRVTSKLNLAGKWLVLLPDDSEVRISKKVKDAALRKSLMDLGREIRPEGCGLIIRTASESMTSLMLKDEADNLYQLWMKIKAKVAGLTSPGILHKRLRLNERLVRDMNDLSRIVTNSREGYLSLLSAQRDQRISEHVSIEFFEEKSSLIFDAFGVESQIDKSLKKRIWLPCGGYLIIDYCEAMTVIDVNSGKMILGKNIEDTALRVNLEAADEIARQIRLRDIGGIIVVDCIDMRLESHRETLLAHLRNAVKQDRSQVRVEGITRLGLVEMTRKRVNEPLRKQLKTGCSYCSSTGEVLAPDETARRALYQVRRLSLSGQRGPFVIQCAPQVAQLLAEMCFIQNGEVYAVPVRGRHTETFDIEQIGKTDTLPRDAVLLKHKD